jgi:hypothetical protein
VVAAPSMVVGNWSNHPRCPSSTENGIRQLAREPSCNRHFTGRAAISGGGRSSSSTSKTGMRLNAPPMLIGTSYSGLSTEISIPSLPKSSELAIEMGEPESTTPSYSVAKPGALTVTNRSQDRQAVGLPLRGRGARIATVSLRASADADEERFTSSWDVSNKDVLIGRHGLQHVVKMSQGVAVGDDLAGVSDCNPSTAKLLEERWFHDVEGISRGSPQMVRSSA